MKKSTNLLLAIGIAGLLWTSCTFAYTQEQQSAYEWAYQYNITTQPTIEVANLNWYVTRQELAKMLTNYIENIAWWMDATTSSCTFRDENQITENLKPYTKKICTYEIMWSDWKDFRPTNKVTRAELGTTISRMLWWNKYNVEWKDYYTQHLNTLKDWWIMNNIETPTKTFAKRWDTFIILKRIYDKFYSTTTYTDTSTIWEEYVSDLYENANVIYETKDWKKYYYDGDFLAILKNLADKKWESDLKKFLDIEAEYYKNGLDEIAWIDDDKISEILWTDIEELDFDKMTKEEKESMIKKFKSGFNELNIENKNRNKNFLNNLENVTKNIKDDKYWLKEKYEKYETFIEYTNTYLDNFLWTYVDLLETAMINWDEESDEWISKTFWLLWLTMAYLWEAMEYQEYLENWAKDTMNLLWLK